MVEFKIKIHPNQRVAYIPKVLFSALGPRARAVADREAALFFAEGLSFADALRSLEIIKADLEHAQDLKRSRKKTREETAKNLKKTEG